MGGARWKQRRQEVQDLATKQKVRLAVSRYGYDPVIVTYTVGPDSYHFRSPESRERAADDTPSVYIHREYHPPQFKCLSEMTLAELDAQRASLRHSASDSRGP